jgi:hypothetical protein
MALRKGERLVSPRSQSSDWECIPRGLLPLVKPLEAEPPRMGSQPPGWEPVRAKLIAFLSAIPPQAFDPPNPPKKRGEINQSPPF